jgi:hypothetical protein
MGQRQYLLCAAILGFAFAFGARAEGGIAVEEIRIKSGWAGLSPESPLVADLVLKPSEDGYTMTGTNRRAGKLAAMAPVEVPVGDVENLVAAVKEPLQAEFAIADLGRTDEDVQAQVDSAMELDEAIEESPASAGKLRAYRESLRRPDMLAKALTAGFRSFHTDDYPRVEIEITLADGSTLVASSESQQYLMLPWAREGEAASYSPAISNALWKLLPEGATNRDRLKGPIDDFELNELIEAGLYDPLSRITAEAAAGGALAELEKTFTVEKARVQKPFAAVGLGKVLFATLRLPSGPTNLGMQVRLPLQGTALKTPEDDVERIRAALLLAQSAPGMSARMREHPQEEFRMADRFGYAWLNERTANQFIEQMKELDKLGQLGDDPDLLRGAVMVEEGKAPIYWIVLADGRSVRWKEFTDAAATTDTIRCDSIPTGEDDVDEIMKLREDDLCVGEIFPGPSQ